MTTLNLSIIETGDDVREESGSITAANWPLNIGSWNSSAKHGGFRFQNVTVPQGATISSATFSIPVVTGSATTNFRVYGANLDNVGQWSGSILPSGVARTTSNTQVTAMPAGTVNITVTGIIQEIVNRSGWASGNSLGLSLIWEGDVGVEYSNFVGISDYSYESSNVCALSIVYSVGTNYSLTASPITTAAVSLQTAVLTQKHTVAAVNINSQNPTLQNALVAQKHALIATAPTLGPPTIDAVIFSSKHLFSASGLNSQPPVLDGPILSQKHNAVGNDIFAQSIFVENSTIIQSHNIGALDIVDGSPKIESPTLNQFGGLTANNLTAQVFIELATLLQKHSLIGVDVSSGNFDVQAAEISQNHQIIATNITTGNSFVQTPSTNSSYNLEASSINTLEVVLDNTTLTQNHFLQPQDINTNSAFVGEISILQRHNLIADILMTLSVVVENPSFFVSGERIVNRKTHTVSRKIPLYISKRNENYIVN